MTSPSYPPAVATSTTYDQGRKGNGHDASPELVARALGGAVRTGSGWDCRCPCHEDRTASLSVSVGDKRPLVVHCHAGCAQADVLAELKKRGLTPERERTVKSRIVATYDYVDEHGVALFQVVRFDPKDFRQRLPTGEWKLGGVRRVLYRLPEVLAADEVVLVEGEKDVESLRELGLVATCNPGGAGKWRKDYARPLEGKAVLVIPDDDPAGEKHLADIVATLPNARVLRLEGAKDVTAWLAKGHDLDELRDLASRAPPAARPGAHNARDPAPARDHAPAREGWTAGLVMDGKAPAKNEANVVATLEQDPLLAGRLRWDTLAKRPEVGAMPWRQAGAGWDYWTDQDDIHLAIWLQRNGLNVRVKVVENAVVAAAASQPHNPVKTYLESVAWDGTDRITAFFQTYFGTTIDPAWKDHAEYLAHAARTLFAQAAARGFDPGCQADYTIVLESRQGRRKSTSLAALVPDKKWFTSQLAKIGTKDAHIDLLGKWIVELSELSAVRRVDVATVKLFLTQDTDHYRALYETHSSDHPRACTFIATTNDETYLPDETGNRRIVPVRVGMGQIALLVRDRNQLWAQAVRLYRDGYAGWERLEELAEGEQEERRQSDPWEDIVRDWLATQTFAECTSQQVLDGAISMPAERQDRTAKMRVGHAMRLAGWTRHLKRDGTRRIWVYRPAGGDGGDGGDKKTPNENNDVTTGTTGTAGVDDENSRARTCAGTDARTCAGTEPKQAPWCGTSGDNPPWTDWVAWRSRCTREPDAHKAWLAAAGGTVDTRGVARLPRGLETGKARDWLESTLAEAGLEVRER